MASSVSTIVNRAKKAIAAEEKAEKVRRKDALTLIQKGIETYGSRRAYALECEMTPVSLKKIANGGPVSNEDIVLLGSAL